MAKYFINKFNYLELHAIALGIAAIITFSSLYGDPIAEDRFRHARETFATLMGILGTIVGFYFGSADRDNDALLNIADIKYSKDNTGLEVTSFGYGGKSPYRYIIKYCFTEDEKNAMRLRNSHHLTDGLSINIPLKDSKPLAGLR